VKTASDIPPASSGSFNDAEALRQWAFLRRTPAERLAWLIEMLEIAYRTGAIKLPHPGPDQLIP
jgi:hypothetical protein